MNGSFSRFPYWLIATALLAGCTLWVVNVPAPESNAGKNQKITTLSSPSPTATLTPGHQAVSPPSTPTPQPTRPPIVYGPDREDFPAGVSPLTGLPVADPDLLEQPALLISIPHFPPTARPQAGLSFAPWVFEYLIATGTTRFLAVFYGEFPFQETPPTGPCEVRMTPFQTTGDPILGNRVWLDLNGNGIQEAGERGIGGVCVALYDDSGHLLQETSTDSNGYYGFNVKAGGTYQLAFTPPSGMTFTRPDVGDEDLDSDADPTTGRTALIRVTADDRRRDAGLLPPLDDPLGGMHPGEGQVGPVRSARLINIHIQNFFQDSCLIHAGATWEIRRLIPTCAQVFKKGDGGAGAMLDISRMIRISEENAARKGSLFNYASNLFSETPPEGGEEARQIDFFFAQLNQSRWVYDPLYQGWLRYVDNTSQETAFHVDTDRLTGRQIEFENVIILFVDHEVIQPLIIEMDLSLGNRGSGLLFRDGKMYRIRWSTRAGEYEQTTGLRRPIAFEDEAGNPFPLRPGKTWIVVATPYSTVEARGDGQWRIRVYAPPGAGEY